jgi:flavin reductase (DIM6/NTAB) family NADH-FMN oxidoreductase RutF
MVPRPIDWTSTITLVLPASPISHRFPSSRHTQQFCVNVVTAPVWKQMIDSANLFPEGKSEFKQTGLTDIPAVKIKVP